MTRNTNPLNAEWRRTYSERGAVDADHSVSINIRAKHIAAGVPGHPLECIAAICTLKALDARAAWYFTSVCYIGWDDDQPLTRYKYSAALKKVIAILDDPDGDRSRITPGIYTLLPPAKWQRLGVDRTRREGSPERGSRPNRSHHPVGRFTVALG